jgi:hypothetical protein
MMSPMIGSDGEIRSEPSFDSVACSSQSPDRIAPDGGRRVLGYTRPVAAQRIAENLAFINWTVLTGLAIGSFVAVVVASLRTDATRGFLSFTAACSVAIGVLAFLSDQALPAPQADTAIRIDPAFDTPRRIALAVFCILAAIETIALARRQRPRAVSAAGVVAASATLVCGALA